MFFPISFFKITSPAEGYLLGSMSKLKKSLSKIIPSSQTNRHAI